MKVFRWFFLGLYTIFTIIPRYMYIGFMCLFDPKKGDLFKYKGKPIIPIAMLGLTISVYLICVFVSSRWYVQRLKINYLTADIIDSTKILEKEGKEIIDTSTEYVPNNNNQYANIGYLTVDFTDLLKQNPDTVGWLKVNNTNVNYSIVQSTDNEYYLHHDFHKRSNYAGWVYGDYRDDFEHFGTNTIIYAHNMINRTMFGSLSWCLKDSWYKDEENQFIKISTPTSNTIWKIFSIYLVAPEVYYLKTYFESDNEHQEFIETLKSRSIYDFGLDVSNKDKILTLSTCSDDGTKRLVIHAKMVKAEYR